MEALWPSGTGSGLCCHFVAQGKSLDLKLETNVPSNCAMTPGGHLFLLAELSGRECEETVKDPQSANSERYFIFHLQNRLFQSP